MKITLLTDERIRLEDSDGPLEIAALSDQQSYSPFHMVASGLATCTLSVLYAWAEQAGLHLHDLAIEVGWSFAERPHRVGRYEVLIEWPGLPEQRRAAAARVAGLCAVHNTLTHPPAVEVQVGGAAVP